MPGIARKGDEGSGHGCYPASAITGGSPDVEIDGIPVARAGDALAPHGCKDCPPKPRSIAGGSSTVFINGMPIARVGDAIEGGGTITSGSSSVSVDDG